ncbi:lipopolysaccharide biosynthesis protein [Cellulomonas bogoriensis]|nr:hypothetical protein [Cellulomonas bogoriensis]
MSETAVRQTRNSRPGLWEIIRRPSLRAVAIMSASSTIAGVVGFGANILMSRQLDPDQRGQVAFVLQLAYLLGPLLMLGVERAALRRDAAETAGAQTRHLVPMALLLGASLLLLVGDARALAAAVAVATAWLVIQRSEALRSHAFRRYTSCFLGYQAVVGVGLLGLFLTGETRWYMWLIPYLVPVVPVLLWELSRILTKPSQTFAAVTRTSMGLLPATLATMLMLRAERVMLPLLASNDQLGLYVAVATATEPVYWIARALADHRAGRTGTDRSVATLVRRLVKDSVLFTVIAAAVGVVVWLLIVPVFGQPYAPARDLVLPLVLAAIALALNRLALAWHLGGPRPSDVSRIEGLTAGVAITTYAVGISLGGALGAAWGTFIVYLIGLLISLVLAVFRQRTENANAPKENQ